MNHYAYLAPNSLLEGKEITFVIEDKQNWLWLGTNDGYIIMIRKIHLFHIVLLTVFPVQSF